MSSGVLWINTDLEMGKSCSKHGNIEIEYDTVTSRTEPEGECLNPEEFLEFSTNTCEAEQKEVGLCASNQDAFSLGWRGADVRFGDLPCANSLEEKSQFCDTQLIVALPPSDDDDYVKKPKEAELSRVIKNSATQTSLSMTDLPRIPFDKQTPTSSEEESHERDEKVKADADSLRSSAASSQEEWSYTLYDFEGRGTVGDNDLSQLMQSICTVVGQSVNKSDHKADKENRALKLKLAIGRQSAEERSHPPKPKTNFSRMLFPPPESEEAMKLSSYIEEKLSVHSRSNRRKCRNNKYANKGCGTDTLRVGSKESLRRNGCNCQRDKKERRERYTPPVSRSRRLVLAEEGECLVTPDIPLSPYKKEQKAQGCKRPVVSPVNGRCQRARCQKPRRAYGTGRSTDEFDPSLHILQDTAEALSDTQFSLPKRQETYPGASAEVAFDPERLLQQCSNVESLSNFVNPNINVAQTSMKSQNTESNSLFSVQVNKNYLMDCTGTHINRFVAPCRRTEAEDINLEQSVLHDPHQPNVHGQMNPSCSTECQDLLETRSQKTDDETCKIESLHLNHTVRWSKGHGRHCKANTDAIVCENRTDVTCTSDRRPRQLDLNANSKDKETKQNSMSESKNCLSHEEALLTGRTDIEDDTRSDGLATANSHCGPSRERKPWPTVNNGIGAVSERTVWPGLEPESAVFPSSGANEPCQQTDAPRNRRGKCPCHFRSAQAKLRLNGHYDEKQRLKVLELPMTLSSGRSPCLPTSHNFRCHTQPCYQEVENVVSDCGANAHHNVNRIQHVYRHEHHHYHYYVDNRV